MFGQQQQQQPFGSGFGQQQPQQQPFGAAPAASPFGGTPAFGQPQGQQQASPFGGTSTGLFGASQPAFGAASAPAFGAAASTGSTFGGGAFGARPAGGFGFGAGSTGGFGASQPAFGATSSPAFGAPSSAPSFGFGAASTPAFGATSSPAFGSQAAAPAFGASTGGALSFGASATPAFGSTTPAFGAASAPAFGGFGAASAPAFGAAASAPAFGAAAAPAFGAAPFGAAAVTQVATGTRVAAYAKHQDKDQSSSASGTAGQNVYYATISAMPVYQTKSTEELRAEDYAAGIKSASSAGAATSPTPGIGAAAATSGAFGGFGASQPAAFGAATTPSTPGGGLFGSPAQSTFGTPAFGAASTPAFGAASTPSLFGSTTSTAFGTPASTPAFGGFGAQSAPAASAAPFGAQQPAQGGGLFGSTGGAFGGFGAASTPAFGSTGVFGQPAASTPAPSFGGFGTPASGGLFGQQPQQPAASAPNPFGATTPGAFGTPAAAPASPFGGTPLFGQQQPQQQQQQAGSVFGGAFGARPASTPAFGFASTGSLFGAASTPATGNLFGSAPASTPAFSFSNQQQSAPSFFSPQPAAATGFGFSSGGLFGSTTSQAAAQQAPGGFFAPQPTQPQPQQQQQLALQQGAPAGVGQAPYGAFPQLPSVNVPEPRVGISARPVRAALTTPRPSPLLTLRTQATPRAGVTSAPRTGGPGSAGRGAVTSPLSAGGEGPASSALLLPTRDNPHKLFIREPPPSTDASPASSLTPTPARTRTPQAAAAAAAAGPSAGAGAGAGTSGGRAQERAEEARGMDRSSMPAANGAPSQKRSPAQANGHAANKENERDRDVDASLLPRLGKLESQDYYTEPSMQELKEMAANDPSRLAHVRDFALCRRNIGRIMWLQPVDVRGLDLDDIALIEQGEVALYTEGCTQPKPPPGTGLNSAAEVTLYNVYKKDAATGELLKDLDSARAFERRLRRYCASRNTKFVTYKPDGGLWRFEVEHFSRYGVPSDSDSDDDDMPPSSAGGSSGSDSKENRGPANGAADGNAGAGVRSKQGAGRRDGQQQRQQRQEEGQQQQQDGGKGESEPEPMEDDQEQGQQQQQQEQAGPSRRSPSQALQVVPSARAPQQTAAERRRQQRSAPPPETVPAGEPLQHALPTRLGVRPQQLLLMRESLFGEGAPEGSFQGAQFFQGAPGAAVPAAPGARAVQGFAQRHAVDGVTGGAAAATATAAVAGGGRVQHNWCRPVRAPLSESPANRRSDQPSSGMFGGADGRDGSNSIVSSGVTAGASPDAQHLPPLPFAAAASRGQPRCVTDASLLLGRSFRGGFGPGGVLVTPVGGTSGQIRISRVTPLAAAEGDPVPQQGQQQQQQQQRALEAARGRVQAALDVHLARSCPATVSDDGDGGGIVPQWALRCSRRQLAGVVSEQLAAVGEGLEQEHLRETWRLVQALWEFIEGEEDDDEDDDMNADAAQSMALAPAGRSSTKRPRAALSAVPADGDGMVTNDAMEASDEEMNGGNGVADDDMGSSEDAQQERQQHRRQHHQQQQQDDMGEFEHPRHETDEEQEEAEEEEAEEEEDSSKAALVQFKRRGALSGWLQRQGRRAAEAAAAAAAAGAPGATAMGLVAQLMASRQLAAAAAVAAALGDARLGVLVAQAGSGGRGVEDVHKQLQVWQQSGILPRHIAPGRHMVLQLLAGQVEAVVGKLGLEWRRALGLYLWYGSSPTDPISSALGAYTSVLTVSTTAAPKPLPPHAASAPHASAGATDTQYELLQLTAGANRFDGDSAAAALLRTSGYSPKPLDYSLAWQLASTLVAVEALRPDDMTGEPLPALARVTASHLEQVQLLRLAPQWAVYIALHLAEPEEWKGLRAQAVRELLCRSAPEWGSSSAIRSFLGQGRLQLPEEWLDEAQALWAGYCNDPTAQLKHLLAAHQWVPAHALFATKVAPALFLKATRANGRLVTGPTATAAAQQLAEAAEHLAAHRHDIHNWGLGGGLYHAWVQLEGISLHEQEGSRQGNDNTQQEQLQAAQALLQQVAMVRAAAGNSSAAAAASASTLSQHGTELQQRAAQQRMVLVRLSRAAERVLQQRDGGLGAAGALLGSVSAITPAPLLCGVASMLGTKLGQVETVA